MDTKQCTKCLQEKPLSAFSEGRRDCKECKARLARVNYQRRANGLASADGHRVSKTTYESHRALVIGIIHTAYLDGQGQLNLNERRHYGQGCDEVIADGQKFFSDGRFARFAEMVGICPDLKPDWK